MKEKNKRLINIAVGLILFVVIIFVVEGELFSRNASIALATMILMIFWWVTKPVHLAVTALLPVLVTAVFNIVPIATVLDDYSSPIVVLLLGANILTLTWMIWGLDKRIAMKMLLIIGPSFRQQLIVWFIVSTILSAFLPNAVVAAALCPIALAMIDYCEKIDQSLKKSSTKHWILLAIIWGAGLGGFGTPMGGAMNLVAIGHIETYIGSEYLYSEWIFNMLPYFIGLIIIISLYFLFVKLDVKKLANSKEYLKEGFKSLGKMRKSEKIAVALFGTAVLLAFTRQFYSDILPAFSPPFAFLLAGFLAFFIKGDEGRPLIKWDYAVKNLNWSLAILFAGGMAAGTLLIGTGASDAIAKYVIRFNITGQLGLIMIFVLLGMFLSNTSSNTAACSVLIPVVISIVSALPYNPLPYVYLSAAACNAAFMLPTSIRAIPLAYGMDAGFMLKKGTAAVIITFIGLTAIGYAVVTLGG